MSWVCPHCGTTATLQSGDVKSGSEGIVPTTAADDEGILLSWFVIKCPSKKCGKFVVDVSANFGQVVHYNTGSRTGGVKGDKTRKVGIGDFRFEPRVAAPLSSFVPKVVTDDYSEACLIKDLSPKAAATLCRRALQGMIRDFWAVSKYTLAQELAAIQPQCDSALFDAMMSLKGIGNIGAHPERDISLIVEVEEGEVESLIELLKILDKEWYVARAARAERLAKVVALGADKAAQQTLPSPKVLAARLGSPVADPAAAKEE